MAKDLDMLADNRYNIMALVFFVPYIVFEFPGTILVRTVGVKAFMGGICTLWGLVMLCFGFAKTWQQIAAMRALLGMFEAGFFPACVYLLSTWYTRCKFESSSSALLIPLILDNR